MGAPSPSEIRRALQELIAAALARKKVAVKAEDVKEGVSLLRDLGVDSLDLLQIVATAEKRFGVRIPEDELKKLDDLDALVRAVEVRLKPAA